MFKKIFFEQKCVFLHLIKNCKPLLLAKISSGQFIGTFKETGCNWSLFDLQ